MNYDEFLISKKISHTASGHDDIAPPWLFDWQQAVTKWSIKKGRAALFMDTGLGKTPCQLAWADSVVRNENKPALILAPLAVAQQTERMARKFGVEAHYVRESNGLKKAINITNYERFHKFSGCEFSGVVLDESSILKSFMGKTKRALMQEYKNTKYKLCCTATPSPNDQMEILNQADFLGIMQSSKALAIWFINDTMNFGNYRLKKHGIDDFYRWVSTWAVGMERPSDIGYSDDGYNLPPLRIHDIIIDVDDTIDAGDNLFRIPEMSATTYNREKRKTLSDRVEKCAEISNASDEQFLTWCELNDESRELARAMKDSVEISGSDPIEKKEAAAIAFMDGDIRVLISKPSIFGFGLNFQQCHKEIFCGLSYSYENYYQAVRRVYRFGQTSPVDIYSVIAHTEKNTLGIIKRKADEHISAKAYMKNELNYANGIEYKMEYGQNEKITMPAFIRGE